MIGQLVNSIEVFQVCDYCFRGTREEDLAETGESRKLMGSDVVVPCVACPNCRNQAQETKE